MKTEATNKAEKHCEKYMKSTEKSIREILEKYYEPDFGIKVFLRRADYIQIKLEYGKNKYHDVDMTYYDNFDNRRKVRCSWSTFSESPTRENKLTSYLQLLLRINEDILDEIDGEKDNAIAKIKTELGRLLKMRNEIYGFYRA